MNKMLSMNRNFSSPWPGVLEEILDYVQLQLMLAGRWDSVEIQVLISRKMVTAEKLKPHIDVFRATLAATARSKVLLQATDEPTHRTDLNIWS